jgi:hypothetical protein
LSTKRQGRIYSLPGNSDQKRRYEAGQNEYTLYLGLLSRRAAKRLGRIYSLPSNRKRGWSQLNSYLGIFTAKRMGKFFLPGNTDSQESVQNIYFLPGNSRQKSSQEAGKYCQPGGRAENTP